MVIEIQGVENGDYVVPVNSTIVCICLLVIVISRYENDIVVITRDLGSASVSCNNNDIIQVNGLIYVPYKVGLEMT